MLGLSHSREILQDPGERRGVPLTISERREQTPYRVPTPDAEESAERGVDRAHAEVLVEHDEPLPHGVEDGGREVCDLGHLNLVAFGAHRRPTARR